MQDTHTISQHMAKSFKNRLWLTQPRNRDVTLNFLFFVDTSAFLYSKTSTTVPSAYGLRESLVLVSERAQTLSKLHRMYM